MKLLFVIDSLGSGGAQRQMVNLACSLKMRGHHVELFTYHPGGHYRSYLDDHGVFVHFFPKGSRFSLTPILDLGTLLRRQYFDIVLAFMDTPNFYVEIASIGLKRTKVIVSERCMYPPGRLPFALRLLQECHRLADAITVNSHHQRERMVREFPWMNNRIKAIYNGYDLTAFRPSNILAVSTPQLSLLAISSVSFKKNSLSLAKALVICRDEYHLKVHVDWIGSLEVSGEGTSPMRQTNALLEQAGLTDWWTWLGERVDIPEQLANHDALIHPSYIEGLPNVVCEALACGRPVLASNVCDHPILIQDGVSGLLFDPTSPQDIAQAIFRFSRKDQSARDSMGVKAREYAEKILSVDRYTDDYECLFKSLI